MPAPPALPSTMWLPDTVNAPSENSSSHSTAVSPLVPVALTSTSFRVRFPALCQDRRLVVRGFVPHVDVFEPEVDAFASNRGF